MWYLLEGCEGTQRIVRKKVEPAWKKQELHPLQRVWTAKAGMNGKELCPVLFHALLTKQIEFWEGVSN